MNEVIPQEILEHKIFMVRRHKVILSPDLAKLYQVEVKVLIQSVKRNHDRFPEDFMFQLSDEEFENLKSQIVTSSWGGARRAKPYAFTEQGVAMLSSVLKSNRAVQVNIQIMRTFVRIREMIVTHKELGLKMSELESKVAKHEGDIRMVFEAIRQLMTPPPAEPKRKIGFHTD